MGNEARHFSKLHGVIHGRGKLGWSGNSSDPEDGRIESDVDCVEMRGFRVKRETRW